MMADCLYRASAKCNDDNDDDVVVDVYTEIIESLATVIWLIKQNLEHVWDMMGNVLLLWHE